VFRPARGVVRQRPEVHDRGTVGGRARQPFEVKKIIIVNTVEASHVVPKLCQMACYRATNVAAVASDEDAHADMLSRGE
jgi:hypothetical protein